MFAEVLSGARLIELAVIKLHSNYGSNVGKRDDKGSVDRKNIQCMAVMDSYAIMYSLESPSPPPSRLTCMKTLQGDVTTEKQKKIPQQRQTLQNATAP